MITRSRISNSNNAALTDICATLKMSAVVSIADSWVYLHMQISCAQNVLFCEFFLNVSCHYIKKDYGRTTSKFSDVMENGSVVVEFKAHYFQGHLNNCVQTMPKTLHTKNSLYNSKKPARMYCILFCLFILLQCNTYFYFALWQRTFTFPSQRRHAITNRGAISICTFTTNNSWGNRSFWTVHESRLQFLKWFRTQIASSSRLRCYFARTCR